MKNRGFTLIELLVVIAIISLLASIVLASLGQTRNKAKDAAIKGDLINFRTSAAIYFSDHGDNYGPLYTSSCPIDIAGGASMFHKDPPNGSEAIHNIIKHAGSLTPVLNRIICFSHGIRYEVIAQLNEVGPGLTPQTLFCIDDKNSTKTYYTSFETMGEFLTYVGIFTNGCI